MRIFLAIIAFSFFWLVTANANAALFYKGESIFDIFDFDSQFWSEFSVIRYYFLLFLLIIFFWFINGISFLEEFFQKKIDLKIYLIRKKKEKKEKVLGIVVLSLLF